ncbi:hypothetical protein WEH80_26930 [Actinomycetes bacterium KLBMP 9759]
MRRRHPADDVLTDLAGGDLTEAEALTFAQLLLVAGYGTTLNQLAITLSVLLRDRALFAAVDTERATIPTAVEAVIRLHACGNGTFVQSHSGRRHRRGADPGGFRSCVNAAASNRDPAVHPRPHELDLHRAATSHFTFGQGPHYCRAPLARAELQIALARVVDRFPRPAQRLAAPGRRARSSRRSVQILDHQQQMHPSRPRACGGGP